MKQILKKSFQITPHTPFIDSLTTIEADQAITLAMLEQFRQKLVLINKKKTEILNTLLLNHFDYIIEKDDILWYNSQIGKINVYTQTPKAAYDDPKFDTT